MIRNGAMAARTFFRKWSDRVPCALRAAHQLFP